MVRGQTQFSTVSRFVKEIPKELISGEIYEPKSYDGYDDYVNSATESTYQKAKKAFRTVATQYGDGRPNRYGAEVGEGYGSTFQKKAKSEPVFTAVANQRAFATVNTSGGLDYGVGDRVRHVKFGDGEVKAVVEGGRDYEVTVDFDKAGTKKMFASFAKLKKI